MEKITTKMMRISLEEDIGHEVGVTILDEIIPKVFVVAVEGSDVGMDTSDGFKVGSKPDLEVGNWKENNVGCDVLLLYSTQDWVR